MTSPRAGLGLLVAGLIACPLTGCPLAVTDRYSLEPTDVPAACRDGEQNEEETDVDCGGPDCLACELEARCRLDADCVSAVCAEGRCAELGCADERSNGDETDVDCGGSCAPCGSGARCRLDADCASGQCTDTGCA